MNELLRVACKALDDKFGLDISVLDISEVSVLTDYFVIVSGNNTNQVKAMADEVTNELFKKGAVMKHSEGYGAANWILLDFGDMIIHIFDKENRSFYNIERIWGDAKTISVKELLG